MPDPPTTTTSQPWTAESTTEETSQPQPAETTTAEPWPAETTTEEATSPNSMTAATGEGVEGMCCCRSS